jgi:hypothetical protein
MTVLRNFSQALDVEKHYLMVLTLGYPTPKTFKPYVCLWQTGYDLRLFLTQRTNSPNSLKITLLLLNDY